MTTKIIILKTETSCFEVQSTHSDANGDNQMLTESFPVVKAVS